MLFGGEALLRLRYIKGRGVAFVGIEKSNGGRRAGARRVILLDARANAPCEQRGAEKKQEPAS